MANKKENNMKCKNEIPKQLTCFANDLKRYDLCVKKYIYIIVLTFLIIFPQTILSQGVYNALDFDGFNDWVKVPESANLDIANQITVSVWANTEVNHTAKIIEKETWNSGWAIGQDKWNGWQVGFVNNSNIKYTIDWGDGVPTIGEWYHIAMTFDGSALKLYVNGQLKNSVSASGSIKLNNEPVSIGSDNGVQKYFKGKIDEVRIWDAACTQTEIQDWMNKTNGLTSQENLVAVWHLDESTVGSYSVIDSKNNNNGIPINMTNDDCVISTAPIGDESNIGTGTSNLSETADVFVDITWDTGGDPGANAIFSAIQVNSTPSIITGLLSNCANTFWEIWLENDDGAFQADVKFHYDSIGGIGDESNLKLFTRANTSTSWSEVANYTIDDEGSNTDGIGSITAENLTGLSQFILTSSNNNNPLPIELLCLTVVCEAPIVTLKWATNSEINNDFFTIERSFNGVDFNILGKIAGAGNSNQPLNYSFTDNTAFNGISYYRLKQTDFDGQFTYSNIIPANCMNEIYKDIRVYPNPATNELTIEISENSEDANFEIINSMGAVVYKDSFIQKTKVQISDFASGTYVIRFGNGNIYEFKKINE